MQASVETVDVVADAKEDVKRRRVSQHNEWLRAIGGDVEDVQVAFRQPF